MDDRVRAIADEHLSARSDDWRRLDDEHVTRDSAIEAIQAALATAEAASGAGEREGSYVAGPIWAEPEDDCFTAEIQTVGGHEVIATVHGGTRDEAECRQAAVLCSLASLPPATDPAMVAVDRATRDIVLYILDAVANYATAEQNGGEFAEAHRRDLAAMNGDVVAEVRVTLADALAAAPTIPATGEAVTVEQMRADAREFVEAADAEGFDPNDALDLIRGFATGHAATEGEGA